MSNQYKYKRITAIVKKLSSEKPRKMFIMFRACIAHQKKKITDKIWTTELSVQGLAENPTNVFSNSKLIDLIHSEVWTLGPSISLFSL